MHLFRLDEAAVLAGVPATGRDDVIRSMAGLFGRSYGIDAARAEEALLERERLGSTGFGRGVAIPHARLAGISGPVAAVARLASPIDYAAADALPVDFVFALLSPAEGGAIHLQALAQISRMLRNERIRAAVSAARDPVAIYAVLADVIDREAA